MSRFSCLLVLIMAACGAGHGAQKIAGGSAPRSYDHAPATAAEAGSEPAPDRPGLGTSWGESVSAPIRFAPFERASAAPWAELVMHYNDADGVAAHASYLG